MHACYNIDRKREPKGDNEKMKTYTWTTEKGAKVEIEVKKTKIEKDCG